MAALLKIARRELDQIRDHALQGYPYEVCGLIGGRGDTAEVDVPVPNASLTPRVAYEMERQAMVDAIAISRMKPTMDRSFAFSEAREAFAYMASGAHFGKVAILIG